MALIQGYITSALTAAGKVPMDWSALRIVGIALAAAATTLEQRAAVQLLQTATMPVQVHRAVIALQQAFRDSTPDEYGFPGKI
jgi:hypothetical protein